MLEQQTLDQLHQLKLNGMIEILHSLQQNPSMHKLTFAEGLSLLVDNELAYKSNKRIERLSKQAKLRYPQAVMADLNYEHKRAVTPETWKYLTTGQWLLNHNNLLLNGPTGIGKTYLACACAKLACQKGISTRYFRLSKLLEMLRIAHADGSYLNLLSQLAKVKCLVIDDWGIDHIEPERRSDLLEIIDDQHEQRTLIIAAQLPVDHWHDYIGEHTIADAILDRFIHNAYQINLKGESLRKVIASN
jgi:DNA replication protein DnaC